VYSIGAAVVEEGREGEVRRVEEMEWRSGGYITSAGDGSQHAAAHIEQIKM